MTYELTREAAEDVAEIFVASNVEHGRAQAEKYQAALIHKLDLVGDFPHMGRRHKRRGVELRVVPQGVHVIIYRVIKDDTALILRIFHQREDWFRYLR
ncbi:MAG: type II toxin-antitoxin system RelE/ParE family toxin [Rhodobacter sp.]|nr:type II toxin-antitoxin system RelE/ParE family toxin [Rhodobacter sp.]